MSKKLILTGLFLAAFAALSGRASADDIFSDEEAAKLSKSAQGSFSGEEAARLKKKSEASFNEDESKLLNKSAAGAFSSEEAALLNKKPRSAAAKRYGSQSGKMGVELTGTYWSLGDGSFEERCFDGTCNGTGADGGKSDQGSIGLGAALFFEGGDDTKAGFSLGYTILPSGEYIKNTAFNYGGSFTGTEKETWENSAYSIPATLYFKIRQSEQINITGGFSVDYIFAKVKYTDNTVWNPLALQSDTTDKSEYTGKRLVPGASLGVEIFPVKNISVLVGLKYMFFGSVTNFTNKNDDPVYTYRYSYSGLRINVAARCYFGG